MGIREEQKEKRRFEIFNAGLELFIQKGYSATKISDIAEKVGMSVGLLFHYFESKEKLYEQLVAYGISGPMSAMPKDSDTPLAYFEQISKDLIGLLKENSFTSKMFILMNQAFYNESAPQSIKDKLKEFDIYTPTAHMIKKGQAEGTIRDGDPYALSVAFWSAINGIAMLLAVSPEIPCPESEWIVDIIRRK